MSRADEPEVLEPELEHAESADAPRASTLDAMLEAAPAPSAVEGTGASETLVGEVLEDRHPTLRGRVRVRWRDAEGESFERWLPALQGLAVRVADRVLMTRASNWPEHVVTGVLDGFARRPEVERAAKASLELRGDETIRVQSRDGVELLEVFEGESGPVVRLLHEDLDLELSGALRIRADSIELEATDGEARIKASDDVVVEGEVIHLN